MVKRTSMQVRITMDEKKRALLAMENAGHATLSSYIRSLILETDLSSANMIKAIYKKVVIDCDTNNITDIKSYNYNNKHSYTFDERYNSF